MSASPYKPLLDEMVKIASSYTFGALLNGFTPDLINVLMRIHREKVNGASSYQTTETLINDALSSQFGIPMGINDFIPSDPDRWKLYELFASWRLLLLAEIETPVVYIPIPTSS